MSEPVLDKVSDGSSVLFWCPGCETYHGVWLRGFAHLNPKGATWEWNGDMVRPTFSPSILVRGTLPITDEERDRIMRGEPVTPRDFVCHSFVRDGQIEFLSDSTHHLAGQTVPLPPRD